MLEASNHTADTNYDMHNRNFGLNAVVAPKERLSLELAYNYSAFLQNNNICYAGTFVAPGSLDMH